MTLLKYQTEKMHGKRIGFFLDLNITELNKKIPI